MEFIVKGRNIELTDDLKQMTEKKIKVKVEKYYNKVVQIEVELSQEKNPKISRNKIAEVTVFTPGEIIRSKESATEMHEAIDKVANKLERQIKKYRSKTIQKGRRANGSAIKTTSLADIDSDLSQQIVKVKSFAIKPTTPEDAIMQMELVGHDFFVFVNSQTGKTSLVYKRNDKKYGLIEPVV